MYLDFPECHGTIMRMKIQQRGGGRRKGLENHVVAVCLTGQRFQPKCPDMIQALTFEPDYRFLLYVPN